MALPKTYLQLVQDAYRECQYAGAPPTSVAGNTGAVADLVAWVRDGYREMQQQYRNWRWMRKPFILRTVAGQKSYAYSAVKDDVFSAYDDNDDIAEFSHWWVSDPHDPPRVYREADGMSSEGWMQCLTWADYRANYQLGGVAVQSGRPDILTVDNTDRLVLWPIPDAAYIVRGEYQRSPQVLQSDTATPEMPAQFHDLIVYYAMSRYAVNAVAPEVLARAREEGGRMMRALEFNQLPTMRFGAAMV